MAQGGAVCAAVYRFARTGLGNVEHVRGAEYDLIAEGYTSRFSLEGDTIRVWAVWPTR